MLRIIGPRITSGSRYYTMPCCWYRYLTCSDSPIYHACTHPGHSLVGVVVAGGVDQIRVHVQDVGVVLGAGHPPGHADGVELGQGAQEDAELAQAETPLGVDGADGAAVLRLGHVLQDKVAPDQTLVRVDLALLSIRS